MITQFSRKLAGWNRQELREQFFWNILADRSFTRSNLFLHYWSLSILLAINIMENSTCRFFIWEKFWCYIICLLFLSNIINRDITAEIEQSINFNIMANHVLFIVIARSTSIQGNYISDWHRLWMDSDYSFENIERRENSSFQTYVIYESWIGNWLEIDFDFEGQIISHDLHGHISRASRSISALFLSIQPIE